jgi:chaperone required for assembly of F1-ATPase
VSAGDGLPQHGGPIDPVEMARADLRKPLPRRFYAAVAVAPQAGGHGVLLDGRGARTPARQPLVLPTEAAAEAVAAEWRSQAEVIDPAAMPLTRLANTALDGVAAQIAPTVAEIVNYAGSDLVCYRAGEPEALVVAQAAAWDPILSFAREALGARFVCAEGVVFVAQPAPALAAVRAAVESIAAAPAAPFRLAALHVMTTLTGSALVALAVAHAAMTAENAWTAAHVDEDHQMRLWGADDEALARRARRWAEMDAAVRLWGLTG